MLEDVRANERVFRTKTEAVSLLPAASNDFAANVDEKNL
jgi:hypothetical protein